MVPARNLLILLASGLRSDVLEDERRWPLRTPGFRALGQRGFRGVAVSACPHEPGGMVSLLTGLHARQHGCLRPDGGSIELRSALPQWLAEAGYHVTGVGAVGPVCDMVHEAIVVDPPSVIESSRCVYLRRAAGAGLGPAIAQQRRQRLRSGPFEAERLLLDVNDDIDGFIASEARAMLERLPTDRPWAMLVMFTGPGNDLPPPAPYGDLVRPSLLREGFRPADLKRLDVLAEPAYPRIMLQRLEPHALAQIRADYLGRAALIDQAVGRLTEVAEARPDASRTWSVVASDTGYLLGEHGLIGRQSFLAGATETPLLVVPPRGGPKLNLQHDEGLLSTVDVAATVAAIAGVDLPAAAMGRSVLPALRGEPMTPLIGGLISEFNHRLMIETDRYKAVFDADTDAMRRCLGVFDLLADPDELRNLTEAAAGQNLIDALRLSICDVLLPMRCGTGVW